MKKYFMMMACAALSAQVASAQALEESKTLDNWYIGINGGVQTKATHAAWMKNLNSNVGVRIGRNITPVFGFAVESNLYFNDHKMPASKTFVRYMNTGVIGTVNLNNWFAGYKGEPRTFEVIPVYGLGWGHTFGHVDGSNSYNALTSKAGIDFAFNLGSNKAWQIYIEPSMNWNLYSGSETTPVASECLNYNLQRSAFQLNVGVNYKFGNSNGTHNFKIASNRQAEIDALNAKVNELRSSNDTKDNTINKLNSENANLKKQLTDCQNKQPEQVVVEKEANVLQPTVIFGQGKSTIDNAQYANIAMVANYMKNHKDSKILIKGYASPEGSKEINQKISEARAEAVKNALVKRYKISASRLTTQGMGATDELFEENDFNRVATFTDTTK